jgi:hypothetical protein
LYDAFSRSSGHNARRREGTGKMHFSPSYGVRKGFIKDPNWPPAQLPEEGTAAQRRLLRVKCTFSVRAPGCEEVQTTGDISSGGAKFTLDAALGTEVEIVANDCVARAKVLQVLKGAGQYTYRVQFVDAQAGGEVFEAAYWSN